MMRTITVSEWWAEGHRRFGDDMMQFRFICPSCGHVASMRDWKDAGASPGEVAFSCVGRYLPSNDAGNHTFTGDGGPCNYAGGGLFGLNPVEVVFPDRQPIRVFEFAEAA